MTRAGAAYRPRRRLLARGRGIVATLSHYQARVEQPLHAHDADQYSFLLLGSLHEAHAAGDFQAAPGWIGIKPAGLPHANRFGRTGALILTVEGAHGDAPRHRGWAMRGDAAVPLLARLSLDASRSPLAEEAIDDLLAIATGAHVDQRRALPALLGAARAQLHEQPEDCRIDALAEAAGFERTHFAHLFRAHFGVPPSVYRAQRMAAKAANAMLSERCTVADAAFAAGFADHSHFTRTLRRFTGLSPRQLRSALA